MEESNKIETMRHTAAHVMAAAVKDYLAEKNIEVKFAIGPVIDNGFYYDFDLSEGSLSEEDLPKIEKKMKYMMKQALKMEREEVSISDALKRTEGQPYKQELIKDLEGEGESQVSFYKLGDVFDDLCRGPHVEHTGKLGPFKLTKVAGAYWKGDEKNKMLQRIYGVMFETQDKLDEYVKMMKEAEARDHRKLGKELDLFTFSDLIGAGLPLWTPKGTILRNEIDNYVWDLRKGKGYQKVEIPHLTKKDLYIKSGHWDKFGDELFKVSTREGHEYVLKPMNCPHHTQIYAHKQRSYRDLPLRFANTTMVYRDEQSGELSGLSRVLSITQDDAHVFCRESQVKEEFLKIWEIIDTFYSTFGFELDIWLSFHDPDNFDAYLGTPELWKKAEASIREIAHDKGVLYTEVKGEAAFYGPKIDFIAKDSLGREWQVATIQLDINMPENFDLFCIDEKGEQERVVMIHAAVTGSIERFTAILIEHYAGAFPTWLSPVQVKILPVVDKFDKYAQEVYQELDNAGVRAEIDDSNDSLGKKIRNAETGKTPYILVVGEKEVESREVAVRKRVAGDQGSIALENFIKNIQEEIEAKD